MELLSLKIKKKYKRKRVKTEHNLMVNVKYWP